MAKVCITPPTTKLVEEVVKEGSVTLEMSYAQAQVIHDILYTAVHMVSKDRTIIEGLSYKFRNEGMKTKHTYTGQLDLGNYEEKGY